MELGNVPMAYKGFLKYMMALRSHFKNKYPTEFKIGNFYQGYMAMNYFSLTPKSLKNEKLKIGLVFNHEKIRFEIWLVGQNKKIQKKYWDLFNGSDWHKYQISKTPQDSIIEHVLVENPGFHQMDSLTEKIKNRTIAFKNDIEIFFMK